jgi:stage V sporulation protein AC
MKMTNSEYNEYIKQKSPDSPLWADLLKAFVVGGLICCVGQGLAQLYEHFGLLTEEAASATSITLVFLGALLTGLGLYDNMAKFAGAGTLVPITGFANAVVSPALEFKSEGFVTGMAAKIFAIAGPVIVFGISASVVYGIILVLFGLA